MSKIPVDEIKEKVNILGYIEAFYPEIKFINSGSWMMGLCPFHDDRTPSFGVKIGGKAYHCFGCGAHGDIINFVEFKENLGFKEACKLIGDNTGIEVNLQPPNPYHEKYKDFFTNCASRYNKNLVAGSEGLEFLTERGIDEDTINVFNIGFVPKDEYKNRSEFPLGNIGGRISFPIYENKKNARVVGMGYRRIDDIKDYKYINDENQTGREAIYKDGKMIKPPQDQNYAGVFVKGDYLYGYNLNYEEIKKARYAIIVEGYTDVISLYQTGIKNVVGVLTADITDNQIALLKKLCDNVLLLLDGDKTGVSKMYKNVPRLYEEGFNVAMAVLDDDKDPADICFDNDFNFNKVSSIISKKTKLAAIAVMKPDFDSFSDMIKKQEEILNNMIKEQREILEDILRKERIRILKKHRPMLEKIADKDLREVFETELRTRLGMS